MKFSLLQLPFFILFGLFFTGCSLTYNLNPPVSSEVHYDKGADKKLSLQIVDARQDQTFIKGITNLEAVTLNIGNVSDPIAWLAQSLQNEFKARGIAAEVYSGDTTKKSPDYTLTVDKYQILSSRTSGFHPFVAYHSFAGKIQAASDQGKIMAYFFYGKVPVMSMDEVQAPCFDMPTSILIKEIAAKINRLAFHQSMNEQKIAALAALIDEKIKNAAPDAYLSIIDLGGSNNPKALEYLMQLADNDDSLIRASALSAIGMIGDKNALPFLKKKFSQYTDIEQVMALKSIGDIGTPEAIEFVKNAQQHTQYSNELGFKFATDLYLQALSK